MPDPVVLKPDNRVTPPMSGTLSRVFWENLASLPLVLSLLFLTLAVLIGPGNSISSALIWMALICAIATFGVLVALHWSKSWHPPRTVNLVANLAYTIFFFALLITGVFEPYLRAQGMENYPGNLGGYIVDDVKRELKAEWLRSAKDLNQADIEQALRNAELPDFVEIEVDVTGRKSADVIYRERGLDRAGRTFRYRLTDVGSGSGEWLPVIQSDD
ncbi:MAG: hypothetical protein ICCCNLDF_00123 [Planctomycetes bacterium]|nr:hypothetical protein [Planctomycetota bacterium]